MRSFANAQAAPCIAALLVLSVAAGLTAQTKLIGDPGPECDPCGVRLDLVVRLGGGDDPGQIGMTAGIVQAQSGEWLVTHMHDPVRVIVYDSTGRYLRAMGRRGAGPGEFRSAGKLIMHKGDTLDVFDVALARVTRLLSTGAHIGELRLPITSIRQAKYVDPQHYLINGDLRTAQTVGLPLHLVNSDGTIVRSFGSTDPVVRSDMPRLHERMISDPLGGSVWVAHKTRYVLEKWSISGELLQRLERKAAWFEAHDRAGRITSNGPPDPMIRDIMEDADGIVWVVVRVADGRWKDAIRYRGAIQGRLPVWAVDDPARYHDSIIEAIDVKTRRVVASTRTDGSVHAFVDRGRLAIYTLDANGEPCMEIYSMKIQSR